MRQDAVLTRAVPLAAAVAIWMAALLPVVGVLDSGRVA